MIISIGGVSNTKGDLSGQLERDTDKTGFSVEATLGKRMDLCSFTLMDSIPGSLAIPTRAEVVVYDALAGAAVTDPPGAISAYNTFKNGAGTEVTSTTPANWTPRLFAGYCATPKYTAEGPQRYIELSSQDYTYRLRSTVVNQAFVAGFTDQYIIQTLFSRYRSDFDTSQVNVVTSSFPAISFPVHSMEQFLERMIKVSRAIYRVDYFKRVTYGLVGQITAPFNFSDVPDFTTTFPTETLDYTPDGSGLMNKVWVIGSTFRSNSQTYVVPVTLVNGVTYQFPLPGDPEVTTVTVTVNGTDQGHVGVVPADGDLTTPSSFKYNVLVQHSPATIAFKTPPPLNSPINVTGKYLFPLLQSVSDPVLIAATNGLIFEAVVRDKRIKDFSLAQQVGKAYLTNQGSTLNGGRFLTKYRSLNNVLLAPGQQVTIKNDALYTGLLKDANGNPTTTATAVITKVTTTLTGDANQPYETEISYADRHVSGGY